GSRIRTKFLVFPAIAGLMAALALVSAWQIVVVHHRLLDRFAREDLAKANRVAALFEDLSNEFIILEFLSEKAVELKEEHIYDFGQRFLDTLRHVIRRVEGLPRTFALAPEEQQRVDELRSLLAGYLGHMVQAVEMASVDSTRAAGMLRDASRESATARAGVT